MHPSFHSYLLPCLARCIILSSYYLLSHDVSLHDHCSYIPSPATYVVVGINVNWGNLQHNQFNMFLAGFTVLVSGGNTLFKDPSNAFRLSVRPLLFSFVVLSYFLKKNSIFMQIIHVHVTFLLYRHHFKSAPLHHLMRL